MHHPLFSRSRRLRRLSSCCLYTLEGFFFHVDSPLIALGQSTLPSHICPERVSCEAARKGANENRSHRCPRVENASLPGISPGPFRCDRIPRANVADSTTHRRFSTRGCSRTSLIVRSRVPVEDESPGFATGSIGVQCASRTAYLSSSSSARSDWMLERGLRESPGVPRQEELGLLRSKRSTPLPAPCALFPPPGAGEAGSIPGERGGGRGGSDDGYGGNKGRGDSRRDLPPARGRRRGLLEGECRRARHAGWMVNTVSRARVLIGKGFAVMRVESPNSRGIRSRARACPGAGTR